MKVLIRDKDLLASLPAASVRQYLKERGWQDNGSWGKKRLGALYLKEMRGHSWDIVFPYQETVADYPSRMADALSTLAQVEERSELEVFFDILRVGAPVADDRAICALREFADILKAGVDAIRAY